MKPQICVSIIPKTTPEALQLITEAEQKDTDLIEVRLDSLENLTRLPELASHGKTPKIASCRRASGTDKEKQRVLLSAAEAGFNYIDADLSWQNLKSFVGEVKAFNAKCIVSFHDYDGSLNSIELNSLLKKQISSGANVCKIVSTAKQIEDNLTLLQFISESSTKTKIVCFAMGELGKTSRLLSPLFGAFFTFASLEHGRETAPGQMTIQEMRTAYDLLGLK